MLKKTITYTTLDGMEVTEDFYFNLSKAELIEMEVSHAGGLSEHLKQVSSSGDGQRIIQAFKDILKRSYGVRSEDGKRFVKTEANWEEFVSSEAYSELFMQLVTDASAAADFVNGVVPKNLEQDIAQIGAEPVPNQDTPQGDAPRKLTEADIREMDSNELKAGLAEGRFTI